MWIAVGLLLLCQVLCLVAAGWWINRTIARIKAQLVEQLRLWVEAPGENEPSKLAQLVDTVGTVVGASAARSIMASLAADKSHMSRVANGIVADTEAQANPLLSILAGGRRGKQAGLMRLAEILGPMLLGGQRSNGGQAPVSPKQNFKMEL